MFSSRRVIGGGGRRSVISHNFSSPYAQRIQIGNYIYYIFFNYNATPGNVGSGRGDGNQYAGNFIVSGTPLVADILVVGGGGAGGSGNVNGHASGTGVGGGGGGGTVKVWKNVILDPDTYTIYVGFGGISGDANASYHNGGMSAIYKQSNFVWALTASGGGAGGSLGNWGNAGGSGGGGGGRRVDYNFTYGGAAGAGVGLSDTLDTYANAGGGGWRRSSVADGRFSKNYSGGGGGGGGATTVGQTVSFDMNRGRNGGYGGRGIDLSSRFPISVYIPGYPYAPGVSSSLIEVEYGAGGGGAAGFGTGGTSLSLSGGTGAGGASAGYNHTGSGGGGGNSVWNNGKNGGSGIVVIKHLAQ